MMVTEYKRRTEELLDWVRESRTWLESDWPGNSLQEVRRKLQEYRDYRSCARKTSEEKKSSLETFFSGKKGQFQSLSQEVKKAWAGLLISEQRLGEKVEADLRRLERLERLAREFRRKAEQVEVWTRNTEERLRQEDFRQLKPDGLRERIKELEVLEFQLTSHQLSVEHLKALGQKLQDWNYSDAALVNSKTEKLQDKLDSLNVLSQQRTQRLEEELRGREDGLGISNDIETWLQIQTETMDIIQKVKEGSHEEKTVFQFSPPAEELEKIFGSGYTRHGVERLKDCWKEITGFDLLDISIVQLIIFLL